VVVVVVVVVVVRILSCVFSLFPNTP